MREREREREGGWAAAKSVFLCFSMVTIQVVNLPERTETVLITKSN